MSFRRVQNARPTSESNPVWLRLIGMFAALSLVFLIPFLIWGEALEAMFTSDGAITWLKGRGRWAWAAGLGLLTADLVLPLPATAVMAALGYVYGPLAGGLIGAAGSFFAGSLAYGLCRLIGRTAAIRIVGEANLTREESRFARVGGCIVALSRILPLFAEVVACLAGLARMPVRSFFIAMACGCVPMGLTFGAIGAAGADHPVLALTLSLVLPPMLWLAVQPLIRRKN